MSSQFPVRARDFILLVKDPIIRQSMKPLLPVLFGLAVFGAAAGNMVYQMWHSSLMESSEYYRPNIPQDHVTSAKESFYCDPGYPTKTLSCY